MDLLLEDDYSMEESSSDKNTLLYQVNQLADEIFQVLDDYNKVVVNLENTVNDFKQEMDIYLQRVYINDPNIIEEETQNLQNQFATYRANLNKYRKIYTQSDRVYNKYVEILAQCEPQGWADTEEQDAWSGNEEMEFSNNNDDNYENDEKNNKSSNESNQDFCDNLETIESTFNSMRQYLGQTSDEAQNLIGEIYNGILQLSQQYGDLMSDWKKEADNVNRRVQTVYTQLDKLALEFEPFPQYSSIVKPISKYNKNWKDTIGRINKCIEITDTECVAQELNYLATQLIPEMQQYRQFLRKSLESLQESAYTEELKNKVNREEIQNISGRQLNMLAESGRVPYLTSRRYQFSQEDEKTLQQRNSRSISEENYNFLLNNYQCFDPEEGSEVEFKNYIDQDPEENIIFIKGNNISSDELFSSSSNTPSSSSPRALESVYSMCYTRSRLKTYLKDANSIVLPCPNDKMPADAAYRFIQIAIPDNVIIPESQIIDIVQNNINANIFFAQPTNITLNRTASAYASLNTHIITSGLGSRACQPDTQQTIYQLVPFIIE